MDNRHPRNNRIRRVIDGRLSGMETNPGFERNVLGRVRGEIIVKKKLSVAFVLIMVLVLLAAGALAALLSSKEFVNQVMAPLAVKDSSKKWTPEQTDEIIRLAEENGLTITDEIRKHLDSMDGMYKEELMRAFVKMDLGSYPASWSIEDQAWYDEILVKCGLSDIQTRFVPTAEEISTQQALSIVMSHIKNEFHDSTDVTNESLYRRFVEYRQFVDRDTGVSPRRWYIYFKALDPTLSSFNFVITPDGTIEEAGSTPGIKSTQAVPTVDSLFDYYRETYGMHYEWTQDTWVELQKEVERAVAEYGHPGKFSTVLLRQKYGEPDTQAIPLEKAIEAAQNAIAQEQGLSQTELESRYTARALYLLGTEGAVWKVNFVDPTRNGPYAFTTRYAEVDAYSGEVLNTGHYEPGVSAWYEPYVLINTLQMPSHG